MEAQELVPFRESGWMVYVRVHSISHSMPISHQQVAGGACRRCREASVKNTAADWTPNQFEVCVCVFLDFQDRNSDMAMA